MSNLSFFSNEQNNNIRILKECVAIGLLTIAVGYLASYIVKPYTKVALPDVCKTWNTKYMLEASLFMTGFLFHFFMEISGLNKSYANYRSLLP
jgi:hypothetical protein